MESLHILFAVIFITFVVGFCFVFWTWHLFRSINYSLESVLTQYTKNTSQQNAIINQANSIVTRLKQLEATVSILVSPPPITNYTAPSVNYTTSSSISQNVTPTG